MLVAWIPHACTRISLQKQIHLYVSHSALVRPSVRLFVCPFLWECFQTSSVCLSMSLSVCVPVSVCRSVILSLCLAVCCLSFSPCSLSVYLFLHTDILTREPISCSLSVSLSCLPASLQAGLACLPVCLSVRLFVCLFVCRFACLPACLHVTGGPQNRLIPWGLVFSHRFLSRSVSARKLALPPVLMRCRSRCASHLEASKTPRTVGICFFASFILTLRLPSKTGPPTRPASI